MVFLRMLPNTLRSLLVICFGLFVCVGARAQTSVTTSRYDIARSGANTNETALTPANVNTSTFGKLFSQPVDGWIYPQPLYMPGIVMGAGTPQAGITHNVLFVATEHDTLYAFDADNNGGANANPLWTASLIDPAHGAGAGELPVPNGDVATNDVVPEIGIMSTPVIDPATNTIYVVAKSTIGHTAYIQRLHALDISTGNEKFGGPVVLSGSVPGNGNGSSGGTLTFDPKWQMNRASLLLLNGIVYIGFGSHGDNGPWHGWILAYNATTLQRTGIWCTSPNSLGSGVWMGGTGLAADIPVGKPFGRMFTVTGNGAFDTTLQVYGDSILRLDLTNGTFTVSDYFTPHDQAAISAADADQGSGGVILLPDAVGGGAGQHQLVQIGKPGRLYVVDRENMGGYTPSNSTDPQEKATVSGVWGSPAYWNGRVYVWGVNDNLKSFAFANGTIPSSTPSSTSAEFSGTYSPSPSISANGITNGIVWTLETDNFAANGQAILYAHDATNVGNRLYASTQNAARDNPGASVKFVVPTVANGKVYVGTETQVSVFGLLNGSTQAQAPVISPAGQTFTGSLQVTITDSTPGASIYYTTDGTTPTTASSLYTGPFTVSTTTTVSATASASGYLQSTVASQTYTLQTQALLPTFSPLPGNYTTALNITIADATPGSSIYYTTDGSTPNPGTGTTKLYSAAIPISATTTVKAVATASGLSVSPVASSTYTITLPGTTIDFSAGFGNSASSMTFNGSTGLDDVRLQLTNGGTNQAGSAFYNTPVNIQAFVTDFSLQLSNAGADGITFTIQNAGLTALGPVGGGLGYGPAAPGGAPGITPSVAIKFDTYSNQGEGTSSTGLYINGASPTIPSINLLSAGLDLRSGTLFSAHLVYDGTTLSMTLTDPVAGKTFSTSWTIDIPGTVGNSVAYLGFTGGTGGQTSSQKIGSWTFSASTGSLPPSISLQPANQTVVAGQSAAFAVLANGTLPLSYQWQKNTINITGATAASYTTPATTTSDSGSTYQVVVTNSVASVTSTPAILTVNATQAPAITSANNATFVVGAQGSFTVTTSGLPVATVSKAGALPSGVTFTNNGDGTATLAGTPASGSAGSYVLTLTATNGVGTPANQTFTLTVSGGGGGGSSNFAYVSGSVTGAVNSGSGSSKTLSVTLHQVPGAGHLLVCAATWRSPTATATMSDPNNGTWAVIGAPKTGIGGLAGYRGQLFYLPSAVNASTTVTLTTSTAVVFRAFECAEYSYSGTVASLDGVPQYSTTPASGGVATVSGLTTSNSSDLVFADCLGVDTTCVAGNGFTGLNDPNGFDAASGGVGTDFYGRTGQIIEYKTSVVAGAQSASFVTGANNDNVILGILALTTNAVQAPPAINSANNTAFTVGTAGTFTVTTTGTPSATLSETGALPNGVTFVNNGNGSATLSGVPAAGSGASYPITITASNGVGTPATQSFVLSVNQPPSITSVNNTTFTAGTAGTFAVTTTGSPAATLSQTGALPSGISLVDNGNGTATLGGTPASATGGTYSITITATNGAGTPATQNFILTVNQAAAITSANSATFTTGTAGSFPVTTTGTPAATLSETGALPSGITFVNNGNGTATLSGTPAAGTNGTYSLTLIANNGVGAPANQPFTLTVNIAQSAPAITSANNATFTVGTAGTFTVTSTGTPASTISETGALPSGITFVNNGNGTATLSGTPAAGTGGNYALTLTANNGVGTAATQSFTLKVNQAPAITSANNATFTVGTAGTFTVTSTGTPASTVSETGALPSGITFVNNGNGTATLSGTPATGTNGTYSLTLIANNGVGAPANQPFTLTVNIAQSAPAITSANNATFTVGTAGTFTVTSTGTPASTVSETGALPSGITFVNNGNGTATLSGTPAAGTGGNYALTLTANNGVGTAATQSFTLKVNQAPAITSANNATFTVGTAGTFSVTSTGTPASTVSETGALPSGITFVNNGNGTATLSGTPATGTNGTYSLTLIANNGVGAPANQPFTLTVNIAQSAPAITSANNATFTVGTAGTFTVTSTGTPASTVSETGALPSGITFVNNGNGTATLSGTPAAGTGGNYALTLTANNGVGTAATQSFTLKVNQAPAITSANNATFTVGTAGTFTVTSTGIPASTVSETGALPSGITFVNNGNGTATLSGTPAAGTGGNYALTLTANNGVGTAATQSFTLKVNQAPAITSANNATFTVGTAGTFTVTSTGTPASTVSETGALPSGITFVNNGNGTATLSGTPATGTNGTYSLTLIANNGVGAPANQPFTLTVNIAQSAPAITSANNATFTVGTAGTFTVTSTGTPASTVSETGALPSGITFVNNGNGTATLSGTPAAGTGGNYALTLTANNGVGTAATQSFTLKVNQAPAITSANNATFTVGTAGTFTVTSTGTPASTISETGALPSGITFVNNGNGTATLSGTPASGSAGAYVLTLTANNGVGTAAMQNFTLTISGAGGGGGTASNFAYVNGSVTGVIDSGGGSSKTLSVTLHQNPGAGHLLVCAATWQSSTATASISDPNNGTWFPIGSAKTGIGSLGPYRGQIFYVPSSVNASTTVTLTISSAVVFRAFECAEYLYTGTISAVDGTPQYSTTPASGGVATIGGLTSSNPSDLVFAACLGVDSSCGAGSGYIGRNDTNAYNVAGGSFGHSFYEYTGQLIEDRVGVAAGPQNATFGTGAGADNVILGMVAF